MLPQLWIFPTPTSTQAIAPVPVADQAIDDSDDENLLQSGENDEPLPEEMDPMNDEDDNRDENSQNVGQSSDFILWNEITPLHLPKSTGKQSYEDLEKDATCGPRNIPSRTKTPLDFFKLFFDGEIMANFVNGTNAHGRVKYVLHSKPVVPYICAK